VSRHQSIEELDVFKRFEELADWGWNCTATWDKFAKWTVGIQMVRALDSVVANIVEGDGRYSTGDSLRFFDYAKASALEARRWIIRAGKRGLVDSDEAKERCGQIDQACRLLNNLITYRRDFKNNIRESVTPYGSPTDIHDLDLSEEED
jgi:four helix bundle protein